MKKNPIYESLVDKSIGSMLSAIEIYNKPDFKYREESFVILAINSWELLLKARILKQSQYKLNSIYCYRSYVDKNGNKTPKKKVIDRNRMGAPKTISIKDAMKRLTDSKELPEAVAGNIESLIELRDNAVHFVNISSISLQVQELGFACVKNYITLLKKWYSKKNLGMYNLYLMPLAYIDGKKIIPATITKEEQLFLRFVQDKLETSDKSGDYDIAIKIELNFQKGNSFEATPVRFDKDGIPVELSEEEIQRKYPLTYDDVCTKASTRYSNFKRNRDFNTYMKEIKRNEKLCYNRRLDPKNIKSQAKAFYSTNVWAVLDTYYSKE